MHNSAKDLLLTYTLSCVVAGFGVGVASYGVMFSVITSSYILLAVFGMIGVLSVVGLIYVYSEFGKYLKSGDDDPLENYDATEKVKSVESVDPAGRLEDVVVKDQMTEKTTIVDKEEPVFETEEEYNSRKKSDIEMDRDF